MLNRDFRARSVPRVEYDHRAREARLQAERVERLLLAKRDAAAMGSRYFRLLRLLGVKVVGSGRSGDAGAGSSSNRRPSATPTRSDLFIGRRRWHGEKRCAPPCRTSRRPEGLALAARRVVRATTLG